VTTEHTSHRPQWGYPTIRYLKAGVTRLRTQRWLLSGEQGLPGVRVLFYHRISDERDELAVSTGRFRAQMEYLAESGFRVVDGVQAAQAIESGEDTAGLIGLTFDDGYRDVMENGMPVLQELGFRATIFVSPSVISGTTKFHWYKGEQPPVLSWDEVLELDQGPIFQFEAHSMSHPVLTDLDDTDVQREIADSKTELAARLDREVHAFCYPAGIFTKRERRLVAESRYRYAFTCEPGANASGGDPFALLRMQIDATDRLVDFRAKVGGGHDSSSFARSVYRRLRHRSAEVSRHSPRDLEPVELEHVAASNGRPRGQVLIVSSFVLPHVGGVEHFVAQAREALRRSGWGVRVLACRPDGEIPDADVVVPTRYIAHSGWPLPVGGWRKLWKEVNRAEVLLVNGHRNVLPVLSALLGRARGKRVLFVIHAGSGSVQRGSIFFRFVARSFDYVLARPALRVSEVLCVAHAGVDFVRRKFGVSGTYLPFPLRPQVPAAEVELEADEPLRIVWAGRLYPERDAATAVHAVDKVREEREAVLHFYGDGISRVELEELAATRPWVVLHGVRSWEEVQDAQGLAHVCLTTSTLESVGLTTLEPLARGIPVVSTAVGDASTYYLDESLARFCVPPRDPGALAREVLELAADYENYRRRFADNGRSLTDSHSGHENSLVQLVDPLSVQTDETAHASAR
jgi:glycosyltransferase involved in cell wall biosynthesis/peptidoglycan/xylan/chitin deacetylase (PgdA/CDA1 family)